MPHRDDQDDGVTVTISENDLTLILDVAVEYVSEQTARLPNMILDVDRSQTKVYVQDVGAAIDRGYAALAAARQPEGVRDGE